ncbi:MAG: D-alanyl-D-alanine carboxypeptidase family protein [Patulibacter sp.]
MIAGALTITAATAATATAAQPAIIAPSAAVIETSTGTVLYAKHARQERGMASTTKLMTALVALDRKPLTSILTAVNYQPGAAETRLGLHTAERMTLADLVRAMMLPSANDAAQTVAQRTGGSVSRFVALMNARARAEGLTGTHFTNPVGLDAANHHTTALDLARIGVLAHDNPFLRATVKRRSITLTSGAVTRTITNRNMALGTKLGGGAVIDGMKTGHTNSSGYSLVGSATRGAVSVVSVVLGDSSESARDADTIKLLRWGISQMQRKQLVGRGDRVASVSVERGKADRVAAVAAEDLSAIVRRGATATLKPVGVPQSLQAPVAAGADVGSARVLVGGTLVGTVPLVTRSAVERESLPAAVVGGIGEHWTGALVALLLIAGGTLTLVRARATGRRRTGAHVAPSPVASSESTERSSAP